jgi:predicted nuclease of restriction endonuclease-like (RecB) superfamily
LLETALAEHIATRRPNAIGFSARNLWRMMQFYQTYRDRPKLSPLVTELSWTHNLIIMSRCKRDEEREFYLRLCIRERWASVSSSGNWTGPSSSAWSYRRQNCHRR